MIRKINIVLSCIIFFAYTYSKAQNNYAYEDDLLNCYYQHHMEYGINIKQIIDSLEQIYIKYGILESSAGESYIKLIHELRDSGYHALEVNPQLKEDVQELSYIPSGVRCFDISLISDTIRLRKSKVLYLMSIFDSVAVKGDISVEIITEEILEVFNAGDFNHAFYKTIGLVILTNIYEFSDFQAQDKGILRQLPSVPEDKRIPVKKENLFLVYINQEDLILVEGKLTQLEELKYLVKKFILETSEKEEIELPVIGKQLRSKGIISLQNDRGTSYKAYIEVQNTLSKVYSEIRNEAALKYFNCEYDKLEKEKKDILNKLYPVRISEANPVKTN